MAMREREQDNLNTHERVRKQRWGGKGISCTTMPAKVDHKSQKHTGIIEVLLARETNENHDPCIQAFAEIKGKKTKMEESGDLCFQKGKEMILNICGASISESIDDETVLISWRKNGVNENFNHTGNSGFQDRRPTFNINCIVLLLYIDCLFSRA